MGILLSTVIRNIGIAVQNANRMIEIAAKESYFAGGYVKRPKPDAETAQPQTKYDREYSPVMYTIHLPEKEPGTDKKKQLQVPVTALIHNTSLQLEQVEIKLKFYITEETGKNNGDMSISFSNKNSKDLQGLSEMTLHFNNAQTPEGVARVNNRHVQTL